MKIKRGTFVQYKSKTLMQLIATFHNKRVYFTSDWDLAKDFERFFDGEFQYCDGGYKVSI